MKASEATANILGVEVGCVTVNSILDEVADWVCQPVLRNIFYVNAHSLNIAYQDAGLRALLNQADLVYPDGISVVWSASWLFGRKMFKITGADWIHEFCERAVHMGWRIYLVGGKPGVAMQASRNLLIKYPGLQIVGVSDGFLLNEKRQMEVLDEIQRAEVQVVLVGMGTPNQEKWITSNRIAIAAPVCWAVGAMLDFVAGVEPRAPRLVRTLALEWLWRLGMDPIGKWQRYLVGNPLFVYRVMRQRLGPTQTP